jgi:hypothetical protein
MLLATEIEQLNHEQINGTEEGIGKKMMEQ